MNRNSTSASHFKDRGTQRGEVTCLRSCNCLSELEASYQVETFQQLSPASASLSYVLLDAIDGWKVVGGCSFSFSGVSLGFISGLLYCLVFMST